ncbi:MAG TPA: orotidine 5'-phosphate decarboxylase / HUMPS family protein, partial [Candidatus Polarisedimenticolaceae bacterium]|nr:orotidine 5'-phosphate decarboxylase / HUMPS family protein [Candidatus Polarisedimenticolaceae bacterium]
MRARQRLWVALDTADPQRALELAGALRDSVGGLKLGLELFVAAGPEIVRRIRATGLGVFLDLKLHDIPNTVAGAAAALARLDIAYYTVHALGGAPMIARAVSAADEAARAAGL